MLLSFRHLWNIRVAVFDQRYQNRPTSMLCVLDICARLREICKFKDVKYAVFHYKIIVPVSSKFLGYPATPNPGGGQFVSM